MPAMAAPTAMVAARSAGRVVDAEVAEVEEERRGGAGGERLPAAVEAVGEGGDGHAGDDADGDAEGGVEADLLGPEAPVGEPERPEGHLDAGGHEEDDVDGAGGERRAGEEAGGQV